MKTSTRCFLEDSGCRSDLTWSDLKWYTVSRINWVSSLPRPHTPSPLLSCYLPSLIQVRAIAFEKTDVFQSRVVALSSVFIKKTKHTRKKLPGFDLIHIWLRLCSLFLYLCCLLKLKTHFQAWFLFIVCWKQSYWWELGGKMHRRLWRMWLLRSQDQDSFQ